MYRRTYIRETLFSLAVSFHTSWLCMYVLLPFLLQFSTNEDVVVGTGECIGYSWSSHVTSPRQLQLCLTGRAWSEPFSLCGVGVERVDLEVEGQTMAIFVRVTDLGGLQKQVRNY